MSYTIVTDSCSDLSQEILRRFSDVCILPLSYTVNRITHTEVIDTAEAAHTFYERLRKGEHCMTAQVPPSAFLEVYEEHAAKGKALLCILFSSALSGTYSSARVALDMVKEKYPHAEIYIVDSLCASAGEGLMVYDALLRRENGMSARENAERALHDRLNYVHWFTVDDLNFLKRGGRCTPSAAFFGTVLGIKPVLHVDDEGRLIAKEKVRGRKQALRALAERYGMLRGNMQGMVFISHADCPKDAEYLANQLTERFGVVPENVVISMIGPVVGSHAGPGTVALFFKGEQRG